MYSPDGRTMGGFGNQFTRWPAQQRAMNVMPQTSGGLFDTQLPAQAMDNSASYPPQLPSNPHTNNPYAIAPAADPFVGFGQQSSPDVRMNNPYTAISGANGGMQMGSPYDFSSGSNPFAAQNQHQTFSEEQADDPHQYAMTSDAERGVQMDSPFTLNPNANPFVARAQQTSSHDTQGSGYPQHAIASDGDRGMQMGNPFAMGPGANQSIQFGCHSPDEPMSDHYAVSPSENLNVALTQTNNQHAINSGSNSFSRHENPFSKGDSNNQSPASSDVAIKREHSDDDYIPGSVAIDDEVDEETSQQTGKKRKINKNGQVRKLREPRGHLRRWDESDVSRALMGIVWACGENGVVIPFAQAAKVVDQDCTSGALQQAILKMHDKMNKDGAQLPKIRMNWPKKPSAGGKSVIRDNGKVPRKKPTLTQATQCNIVSLPARPRHMVLAFGVVTQQESVLPMAESHLGQSAIAGAKHEQDDEMLSSPQHVSDQSPSTPVRPPRSPSCPPAPRHPVARRPALVDPSIGGTTINRRLFSDDAPPSLANFAQQRATGYTQQQGLDSPTNLRNRRLQQGRAHNAQLGPLAVFNADFEQRNTPDALAQWSSSSSMRLNAAMSRNAASSTDFTMIHSPMSGRFQADGSPQDLSNFPGMQSSFSGGDSSQLSGPISSIDDLSPGLGPAFAPDRRDSAFQSGAQSANSRQGSTGPMNRSAREAHQALQASLEAAAAERSMVSTPSQAMRAYHSLQQPRQQLSLGLDTLTNPFVGTFADAFDGSFSPMHHSGGEMDGPFGPPSTTDADMDFGDD
ncbi:hypothetical protein P171DRAFT_262908 [Karstenula rhodostoma CBS 690.94]|uniref:Uncharacterized protein n=1 Tax=Karstenula rhodostoma CBS 690.94 TaxID=1392251 RepID=A0A9P4UDR4_9PLEO|nr:hypothetical protein P171DRAFT_262908 [Karstenula rhodostoma CBS 690.94]